MSSKTIITRFDIGYTAIALHENEIIKNHVHSIHIISDSDGTTIEYVLITTGKTVKNKDGRTRRFRESDLFTTKEELLESL